MGDKSRYTIFQNCKNEVNLETRSENIDFKIRADSNFATFAYRKSSRGELRYVFYPSFQLRLISLLILFNCSFLTGIFYYLNDFIFNVPTIAVMVLVLSTSLSMLLKSFDSITVNNTQQTIEIKRSFSRTKMPSIAVIETSSIIKIEFLFGLHLPKKTFYLKLSDGRLIRLNIGFKPLHPLTAKFETIVKDLSDRLNIDYVLR